jgi:hypothetical protein
MASSPAQAAACSGAITFGADFAGSYSCNSLGTPTGVTGQLGGINFLNNNTLLIGGNANAGSGYIAQIGVIRDGDGHITGFSAPSSTFASAPNIDGGLAFGPNGVLFATGYPNNTLLQYLPGSSAPDKIVSLSGITSSVGTLQFVPAGFSGAGQLKIASYSGGGFYSATLTPDGMGTFDITATNLERSIGGGPEGLVYVKGMNAGFGADSILVSEYSSGQVGVYGSAANGNPTGTRRTFLSGLSGAEGAVIDPLTGDFLFSTFGGGNQIVVISGFVTPPNPGVPEPATWAMLIMGFGAAGTTLRIRRRVTAVAA